MSDPVRKRGEKGRSTVWVGRVLDLWLAILGFVYFDPSEYEGQGLRIDNKVPFAIIETQLVNPEEDITFNSSEEEPFLIYAIGFVSETVESNWVM